MGTLESVLSGMRPAPQDMEWQRRLAGEFANHLQVPGTCKDCGGEVTFVSRTEDMSNHPAMEVLANIIVCNDCAYFRSALRDYKNRLGTIITVYRRMTESLMGKENDLRASGQVTKIAPILEKQAAIDTEVLASVRGLMASIVRAFCTKTGQQHPGTAEVDHWAGVAVNIKMAGNLGSRYEAAGKFITPEDTVWQVMKQITSHFGVRIQNHWGSATRPSSDKHAAGIPVSIIPSVKRTANPARFMNGHVDPVQAPASPAADFDDCPL